MLSNETLIPHLNHAEEFLRKKEYAQTLRLINNTLLPNLQCFLDENKQRCLTLIHDFILLSYSEYFSLDKVVELYKDVTSRLKQVCGLNNISIQIEFHKRAGEILLGIDDFKKALEYVSQSLWLAEGVAFDSGSIVSLLQKIDIKMTLAFLEPFNLFKIMSDELSVVSQQSVDKFRKSVDRVEKFTHILEIHQQWSLALNYYHEILKHSQSKILGDSFNASVILKKIELLNSYVLEKESPPKLVVSSPWQARRDELRAYRNDFAKAIKSDKDVFESQANFTYRVRGMLNEIVREIVAILGEAPCGFSLLGLGSMARGDMLPYSDIDIAMFIADAQYKHHMYFQTLIQWFDKEVNLIGEMNGLHIDTLTPLTDSDKSQLDSVDNIFNGFNPQQLEVTQSECHAIYNPYEIYSDTAGEKLLSDFQDKINTCFQKPIPDDEDSTSLAKRWAICHLNDIRSYLRCNTLPLASGKNPDIKKDFIQPIGLFYEIMLRYHQLNFSTTRERMEKLKLHMTDSFYCLTQHCLQHLTKLRIAQHCRDRYQSDEIPNNPNMEDLFKLHEGLIRILFYVHEDDLKEPFDAYLCYFKNFCSKSFDKEPFSKKDLEQLPKPENVLALFIEMTLELRDYNYIEAVYRLLSNLPYLEAENLRQKLIELLTPHSSEQNIAKLIETLIHIPNNYGLRYSEILAYRRLDEDLLSAITAAHATLSNPINVEIKWIDSQGKQCTRYLRSDCAAQIIDNKTGKIHRQFANSLHDVAKIQLKEGRWFIKRMPLMPMMDYAVDIWHRRLIGHGCVATQLLRFTIEAPGQTFDKVSYPVMCCPSMGEVNLHQALNKNSTPTLDFRINHELYSELVLAQLLLNSGDASSRNFVLSQFQGKESLSSIDNEQQFVVPIVKESANNKVRYTNVLFCLNQANEPLDKKVIEGFVKFNNLMNLINEWVKTVSQREKYYTQLFHEKEELKRLYAEKENCRFLPNITLPEGTLGRLLMYLNFVITSLQLKLQKKEKLPTALELLIIYNERLGKYYADNFEHKTPEDRLAKVTNISQASVSSSLVLQYSLEIIPTLEEVNRMGRFSLIAGKREINAIYNYVPDFSRLLDRQGKSDIKRQQVLLSLLALSSHRTMNLSHCVVLNDELLQLALKKSTQLETLDISYCAEITEESIYYLADNHKDLKSLTLKCNSVLKTIGGYFRSPVFLKLEELSVIGCGILNSLNFNAPLLKKYKLQGCPLLKNVSSNVATYHKSLQWLYLVNLRIENAAFNNKFEVLEYLSIENCHEMTKVELKAPKLREFRIEQTGKLNQISITNSTNLSLFKLNICNELTVNNISEIAKMQMAGCEIQLENCEKLKDFGKISAGIGFFVKPRAVHVENSTILMKPYDPNEVSELLKLVAEGRLREVEELLKSNRNLILAQGDITDFSGREFKNITAFQLAVWYLDNEMWEIILKYFLNKQQATAQLNAFENDRNDIADRHGLHFDFDPFIKACEAFLGGAREEQVRWSVHEKGQLIRRWLARAWRINLPAAGLPHRPLSRSNPYLFDLRPGLLTEFKVTATLAVVLAIKADKNTALSGLKVSLLGSNSMLPGLKH